MTTRVLIPLDGSAFSRQILPHVRLLLRPDEHELTLLRVAAPPALPMRDAPATVSVDYLSVPIEAMPGPERGRAAVEPAQIEAHARAAIEDELNEDVYYLQAAGFVVTTAVRFGEPAAEIVRFVDEHNIGLVAMATHGRTGLQRLVLGSVAEQVLRRVGVPVLLIRPFEGAASRG